MSFSDAMPCNPTDAGPQTLLALSHQQSANGEPEALDMAMTGYDLALKSGQDAFWAAALAGKAAYDRGRYDQAQGYFANAVLMRPEDSRAFVALATSAYMAGDPQVASLAADLVAELSADSETRQAALRIGALADAAKGQQARAWTRYEGQLLPRQSQWQDVRRQCRGQ
jgi:tetratricopeptide (TPR) repeat protein